MKGMDVDSKVMAAPAVSDVCADSAPLVEGM